MKNANYDSSSTMGPYTAAKGNSPGPKIQKKGGALGAPPKVGPGG